MVTRPHDKESLADRYAAMVGLKGFEASYPHELSGGMLKRAELARALGRQARHSLHGRTLRRARCAHEPAHAHELLRILAKERHTVVMVTHDVEEATHIADRILVLSPRPTRIQATFEVSLRHPRILTGPEVQELRTAILRELGVDSFSA